MSKYKVFPTHAINLCQDDLEWLMVEFQDFSSLDEVTQKEMMEGIQELGGDPKEASDVWNDGLLELSDIQLQRCLDRYHTEEMWSS